MGEGAIILGKLAGLVFELSVIGTVIYGLYRWSKWVYTQLKSLWPKG